MNPLYTQLQWLPCPPQDFSRRLNALSDESEQLGRSLQTLASFALDLGQMIQMYKAIDKMRRERKCLNPLVPFKLAILSNSTTALISPAMVAAAARHGILLDVVQFSYGQVAQEALLPNSEVNQSQSDGVLFAMDYRAFALQAPIADRKASAAKVESTMSYFQKLRNGIKSNSNALCIFQSLVPPTDNLYGSLDRALPGTTRYLIDNINCELAAFTLEGGDVLVDVAALAELVGTANWHDTHLWNLGKFPFSDAFVPLYAEHVARIIAAIRGKSRKALVLDLDNTIWGGIVGDDGLEGISIARGDARGEAYLTVQQMALELRSRGIILAVSSKNTEELARAPFEKHPDMLLRMEHIAVFRANWNDKASNIEAIAEELNLGLDAIVLLDDDPFERRLVRQILPQVAVPELPSNPADFARVLSAGGYFESVVFASEDLNRADFYQANSRRVNLLKHSDGVDTYLASLDMTITFQFFDALSRPRIVQLINRSNQYNLTTRRYTIPEVLAAENAREVFTLQVRLADIFGDNGMVSVVICRLSEPGVWDIDTWLMSCRVLGRKIEQRVLQEILVHARAEQIIKITGTYKPTHRNKPAADHYMRMGFTKTFEDGAGLTQWELFVNDASPELTPMKVVSCIRAGE
ncbi:MAG TPA: HAD-IIIC family phosphatase [Acidobacteriaceae bacterium]|nr:HAD-IIIC family phosphatase [Acidobacteriaceae bacterium]